MVVATHNHEAVENLAAFPGAGVLNQVQKQQILDLTEGGAPARLILSTMKRSDSAFLATGQDIYNVRKRDRAEFLLGRSPLEALLDTLEETAIGHELDRDLSSGQSTRLLIAPKPCISHTLIFL